MVLVEIADFVFSVVGVLSSIIAAVLWFKSSRIKMLVSPDTIKDELAEVARWNAYAAFASFVAALCLAYTFCRQIHLPY